MVLRVNPAEADEARRVIEDYRNAPTPEDGMADDDDDK